MIKVEKTLQLSPLPGKLRRFGIASKKLNFLLNLKADVAQLVEQLIRNQQVCGSIPHVGSTLLMNIEE